MGKKRWEYAVRYKNGYVETFESKRAAKTVMYGTDRLVRRRVGKWKDAR